MYKEIAVDPQCMSEFHYYGLLKKDFGFDKGRYIAAELPKWADESFQVLKQSSMQEVNKKSVKNFLNKLKKEKGKGIIFLSKDRSDITTTSYQDWIDWWNEQKEHRPFSTTISETTTEGSISYSDILEEPICWRTPPSISVDKSANAIVDSFHTLLVISKDVTIIDQYLKLQSNDVLKEIFSRFQSYSNLRSIAIVTAMTSKKDAYKVFQDEYVKYFVRSIRAELIIVPDKYFHDRYIISEKGALQLGQGFKEDIPKGAHSDTLKVFLTSNEDAKAAKTSLVKALSDRKAKKFVLNKIA